MQIHDDIHARNGHTSRGFREGLGVELAEVRQFIAACDTVHALAQTLPPHAASVRALQATQDSIICCSPSFAAASRCSALCPWPIPQHGARLKSANRTTNLYKVHEGRVKPPTRSVRASWQWLEIELTIVEMDCPCLWPLLRAARCRTNQQDPTSNAPGYIHPSSTPPLP